MTYVDDATPHADWVLWLAGEADRLSGALNTAHADNVALSGRVTAQDAEIAQLRADLAACQASNQPPFTLQIGYATEPYDAAEVKRLGAWSGAKWRRTYLPPMAPGATFPSNPPFAADAPNGLFTAHTIKGPVPKGTSQSMGARLTRLLTGADDEAWIAYIMKSQKNSILGTEHEPEDDFRAGGWPKSLYRNGQVKFGELVREANRRDGGHRKVSINLMSSTPTADAKLFLPDPAAYDIYGVDGYNWPSRAPNQPPPRWREAGEIFAEDVALAKELGKEFAIFEFGCRRSGTYENVNNSNYQPTAAEIEAQRQWCVNARAYFLEVKPVLVSYFHHDWWLMQESGHRALGGTV